MKAYIQSDMFWDGFPKRYIKAFKVHKFTKYMTSSNGRKFPVTVRMGEVDSLKQLVGIAEKLDEPLIIMPKGKEKYNTIEIYDGYRE